MHTTVVAEYFKFLLGNFSSAETICVNTVFDFSYAKEQSCRADGASAFWILDFFFKSKGQRAKKMLFIHTR